MKDFFLHFFLAFSSKRFYFSQDKGKGYQESNTSSPVAGQAAARPEAGGRQAATGREEEAREGENDE